ncbi:MAG: hypothetical protein IPM16_14010 [Chloroflexi bacterium]|nr:hypothetical protein [Chloroflexota bacterium]
MSFEERATEIASRSPLDYDIVLLADPSSIADRPDYASLEPVWRDMGARQYSSWEAFAYTLSEDVPDIIVVDQSVLESVDLTWTNATYREGIIYIGIDLGFDDMVTLTGDLCVDDINRGIERRFPHNVWIFFYSYSVPSADGKSAVPRSAELRDSVDPLATETCGLSDNSTPTFSESITLYQGFSFEPIYDGSDWLVRFTSKLMEVTYEYGMAPDQTKQRGN